MSQMQFVSRFAVPTLSAGVLAAFVGVVISPARSTEAALLEEGIGPQPLIGLDDDRQDNAALQAGAGREPVAQPTAEHLRVVLRTATSCSGGPGMM